MKPGTADRLRAIVLGASYGLSHQEISKMLGVPKSAVSALRSKYIVGDTPEAGVNALYDRWIYVHDIRAMGARAVEETT